MYSHFLRRSLPALLISGIAVAVLAGGNILLHRKNTEVRARIDDMVRISRNRGIIRREVSHLQAQIDRIETYVRTPEGTHAERELLLAGLDRIRNDVILGNIAFSNIENGKEPALPFIINFDYAGYYPLVKLLDELERSRFPFFGFKSFSFEKSGPDSAQCKVAGALVTQKVGG